MSFRVAPSGLWAGNDGLWSTFNVNLGLGSNSQQVQVLPATSQSVIWAVLPSGCILTTDTDCSYRGNAFNPLDGGDTWVWHNKSTSDPDYMLPTQSESPLNYSAVGGEVGSDDLILDWGGKSAPKQNEALQNVLVACYQATTPWLGLLGLSGFDSYLYNASTSQPGLLSRLKANKNIKARYWAYTAGAGNASPQTFASLTFGGYDKQRVADMTEALNVGFEEGSQYLTVSIKAITITGGGTSSASDLPVNAFIDSVVPEIWLPQAVCAAFESQLGLVWNETLGIYLISEAQHANLLEKDPQITFTLTDPEGQGNVDIQLPYSAFDMSVSYPLANISDSTTTLKYFPLKRSAEGDTNSVYLGRTFLQYAYVDTSPQRQLQLTDESRYVTADYDRSVFTVSPALLPTEQDVYELHTVNPPGYQALSAGAIAGIAIAAAAVTALAAFLVYWFWWRRRPGYQKPGARSLRSASVGNTTVVGETELGDWDGEFYKPPITSETQTPNGMPTADEYFKHELDASAAVGPQVQRYEMDAGTVRPSQHRHGMSWGSAQSGVSSMSDERIRGLAGEPSPPLGGRGSPSPPLSGGPGGHSRQHSAGSPWSPWGPPHEMP